MIIKILSVILMCLFLSMNSYAETVVVMWSLKGKIFEEVCEGFEKQIKIIAPQLNVIYKKEITKEEAITAYEDAAVNADGIVYLRNWGAQYLVAHPISKPGFVGGCLNPVEFGIVPALDAPPEKNITGVTYYIPTDQQFNFYTKIYPQLKRICLIVDPRNGAAIPDKKETETACKKNNIEYMAIECTSIEEIKSKTTAIKDKVDAFISSNCGFIMDNTSIIVDIAGSKPVFGYSLQGIKGGAIGGLVANNVKLGTYLAESVCDVVIHKKNIRDVKFKIDEEPRIYINKNSLKRLMKVVQIPTAILKTATMVE